MFPQQPQQSAPTGGQQGLSLTDLANFMTNKRNMSTDQLKSEIEKIAQSRGMTPDQLSNVVSQAANVMKSLGLK